MSARAELKEVQEKLAKLDPNNRDNLVEIARLKTLESELIKQAAAEEELQVQHEERVKESVDKIFTTLDSEIIEGFTIRELFLDEARYQLASIWFKTQLKEQADSFSKQLMAEQAEGREKDVVIEDKDRIIAALKDEIHQRDVKIGQIELERDQATLYRDNAYTQIEEHKAEIKRLNDKVDEQRAELAIGVRGEMKVINNLDGAKELAERIRASLIPAVAIDQINGTTIRIVHPDGTTSEDSWLAKGKYRLLDEEEAGRFRQELAEKAKAESVPSNPPLVEEPTFQVPQSNESQGVPSVQSETDGGNNDADGKDVDAAGTESLEARVAALEAQVFGYVKGVA